MEGAEIERVNMKRDGGKDISPKGAEPLGISPEVNEGAGRDCRGFKD
jgi:hypothetical protein